MPSERDQSQDSTDISVYQLAEEVAGGDPCSDDGAREVASELLRVREQVRIARLRLHSDEVDRATEKLDELAASMGLL